MNTRALPSDIIYIIVCYALQTRFVGKREFKKGLKLLAVCQEWRCAALPIIYKYAYITSGRDERISDDNYDSIHELAKKQSAVTVDTNIDLIQSQNCVEYVQKLNVGVHYKVLPFLGHAKIASVLSTAAEIWPNAHTLNMAMFTCTYVGKYKDIESYTSVISDIASRFTQLLPNVKRLMFQGNIVNPMAQIFYGNIAGAYNNQLEKLSSKHPIVVPSNLIFANLKHFDISFNNMTNYQPPSINPRVLESLKMTDVLGTNFWDSFCVGGQSNEIKFLSLTKLYVSQYQFDTLVDNTYSLHKLHFPYLQELIIDSCTTELPWLYTTVLPAAMNNLVINAKYELFKIPESFAFPVVENLSLNIGSDFSDGRTELLESANRILANTNQFSNVNLSIEDRSFTINPQDIHSNNITKLFIGGPMTINNFYAYLTKMNQLVEIKCGRLMADEDMELVRFPDPDQFSDPYEMPLNICTETVEIKFSNPGDEIKKKVNVIKCLLLKLPSLTKLMTTDVTEYLVIEFIDAYMCNYPHLLAVQLNLDTTNGGMYNYPSDYDSNYEASNYDSDYDGSNYFTN